MRKLFALMLATLTAGLIGCTTLSSLSPMSSSSPEEKYKADQPPPIQKSTDPARTNLPPVRISDSRTPPNPDSINDQNYLDEARRLENTLQAEGRAMRTPGR